MAQIRSVTNFANASNILDISWHITDIPMGPLNVALVLAKLVDGVPVDESINSASITTRTVPLGDISESTLRIRSVGDGLYMVDLATLGKTIGSNGGSDAIEVVALHQ